MSKYLSAIEAATLLGRSESFIRKRIKSGELSAKKVNGRWGIRRKDLDALPPRLTPRAVRKDEPSKSRDEPSGVVDEPSGVMDEPSKFGDVTFEWRTDLLEQVARLEADKQALLGDRQDLVERNDVLEAKVREILEKSQDETMQLANRIADLVERQHESASRIYELEPVAEQVPMLQAALDSMHDDIEAIASRPVTGPVFRLLTKGRLRR
jgi:excisionase family DNA binding protein